MPASQLLGRISALYLLSFFLILELCMCAINATFPSQEDVVLDNSTATADNDTEIVETTSGSCLLRFHRRQQYFRLTVNHHVPHPRYRLRHRILDPLLRLASESISSASAGNPYGSVPPGWSRDWHVRTYEMELLQGRGPQQAMWFEVEDTIKGIRKCMPHVGYLQPRFELYRPTVPVKPKLTWPVIWGEILVRGFQEGKEVW